MSALGQKQTFALQKGMSALPPIADIRGAKTNVRFVPIADIGRPAMAATTAPPAPNERTGDSLWGSAALFQAEDTLKPGSRPPSRYRR
jgi:hypothetical protein